MDEGSKDRREARLRVTRIRKNMPGQRNQDPINEETGKLHERPSNMQIKNNNSEVRQPGCQAQPPCFLTP